jgi:FixJ family two-component response regulator
MKAGAIDFLSKPVDPDALLAAVDRGLAQDAGRRAEPLGSMTRQPAPRDHHG